MILSSFFLNCNKMVNYYNSYLIGKIFIAIYCHIPQLIARTN